MTTTEVEEHQTRTLQGLSEFLPHQLRWTLSDDQIYGTLTCGAGEGAPCRKWCSKSCDSECYHGEADWIDAGHCLGTTWMENDADSIAECHDYLAEPGPISLHDGAVLFRWTGFRYEWRYAFTEAAKGVKPPDTAA